MFNLFLTAVVFIGSFAIGYVLISRVPPLLHTPLMSMTNAISAITILAALILFSVPTTLREKVLGSIANITSAGRCCRFCPGRWVSMIQVPAMVTFQHGAGETINNLLEAILTVNTKQG